MHHAEEMWVFGIPATPEAVRLADSAHRTGAGMTAAPCTGERPLSEETSMAQHSPLVPRDSRALDPDDFSFFGFDDLGLWLKCRIRQVDIRGGTSGVSNRQPSPTNMRWARRSSISVGCSTGRWGSAPARLPGLWPRAQPTAPDRTFAYVACPFVVVERTLIRAHPARQGFGSALALGGA